MMENYTVEQLRQIARNKNLRGYSQLRKAELVKFVKSPQRKSPPRRKSKNKKSRSMSCERKTSQFISTSTRDKIINAKLQGVDWFIITMEGCGYCDEAKKLLKTHKLKFKTQMLTQKNQDRIYESIDSLTKKYRYFPMIFYKGKFLGGYKELKKKLEK